LPQDARSIPRKPGLDGNWKALQDHPMNDAATGAGQPSRTLAIIWHSRTGGAQAMAQAVAAGAGDGGRLLAAGEATAVDLLAADAYVFVCPENLGTMSGVMKDLFDRTYYPLLGRVEGRAYATAIAAGSGGQGAEAQIDRIVTGWRLRRVAEPLIVDFAAQTPEAILAAKTLPGTARQACHDLGAAMVEGLKLGIF
jgi:NAD(P)H-dependent FMN reductase